MLDHLDLTASATAIRTAVAAVLKSGRASTADVGGTATTAQVGDAVLAAV